MQLATNAADKVSAQTVRLSANELVFELRYRANAKILDHRGEWAESLAAEMGLSEWHIIENRIDLFSADKSRRAFVGFRNAGFLAVDVPTRDYFADHVGKLMRKLFSFSAFGSRVRVDRLGLRARFATRFEGTFDELATRFASRYLWISEAAKKALGDDVTLVDVGAPLNFKDRNGSFNTVSGPMRRDEFVKTFGNDGVFPDVGLYFDIDYFKLPDAVLNEREIGGLVAVYSRGAWEKYERVRDLILR